MYRVREITGTAAVVAALVILPFSGAVLAHGEAGEQAAEFYEHMDVYADNINDIIASVEAITNDYEPDNDYAEAIDDLTEQWESVEFHQAVEENAMALYPPIWAALGAFSKALKQGAPDDTVEAKAADIKAALWQGYGALKLLAARHDQNKSDHHDEDHEENEAHAQTSGEAVIDTIDENLDKVLVLYKKGENKAAGELIYNTYMNYFEGIEGELIEQNADLVSKLEVDFNATLPTLIKNDAPARKVAAQIEAMQDDLDTAAELLETAEAQETSVF